jgi:hypothetical protein
MVSVKSNTAGPAYDEMQIFQDRLDGGLMRTKSAHEQAHGIVIIDRAALIAGVAKQDLQASSGLLGALGAYPWEPFLACA